jgi:glycosyltransferase involved in cell wall biosynthesis
MDADATDQGMQTAAPEPAAPEHLIPHGAGGPRRPRVTMVTVRSLSYFPPVRYEAESLAARGWEVRVITIADRGKEPVAPPPGVEQQVLRLLSRSLPSGALMGVKYLELSARQARAARAWPADLYVAHDLPALLPALRAARHRSAPVVYRAHELWTERQYVPGRPLWRAIEGRLARRADLVVAPTAERAAFLQERCQLPAPPLVVMNCPPRREPKGRSRLTEVLAAVGIPTEGRRLVIYQGAVAASRCALEVIAASAMLPPDVLVVLMGPVDRHLRVGLQTALASAGGKAALLPAVSPEEVWPAICSADAGLALYRPDCANNRLCAPNKVFEYMMAGLPIVGSRGPTLEALVDRAGVGVLVDPEQPQDIARGIVAALTLDPETVRERALALARRSYNWETQAAALLQAYEQLVARRSAPAGAAV